MRALVSEWCRPVTQRLEENYSGYWLRYGWLMMIAALAALADYASTVHFMLLDGVHLEVHPAIRLGAEFYGPVLGPLIGKLLQLWALFVVTLYARRIAEHVFLITAAVYAWAAWYNVWGRISY